MEVSQLLIDAEPSVSPGQTDRSPSTEELHAHEATAKRVPRNPLEHEEFDKDMIIVSCRILNFGDSSCSNGKSHEFVEWFYSKHPDTYRPRSGYLSTEKYVLEIFERSFRKNFPKFCERRKVIIIDNSMIMGAQDDRYLLRSHTGRHYKQDNSKASRPQRLRTDERAAAGHRQSASTDSQCLRLRSTSFSCR